MTYGQSDGSTVDGYNTTGEGYIIIDNATPSGKSGGYISSCEFTNYGIIPKQVNGSSTTKYCDELWMNNNQNSYVWIGGNSSAGTLVGVFYMYFCATASSANWDIGTALSCKPYTQNNE